MTVERLNVANVRAAAAVIAASHATYPAFQQLFPDPAVRQRVLMPFMTAAVRDAAVHGHALVARDQDDVVGVALWMPPGTYPPSAARKARMTPGLTRAAFAARGAFRNFLRVGAALDEAHPPGSRWYLEAMGVHPRAQRRGVGSQLMKPALAQADRAHQPCYLQTSDPANVDYYRRFGFEVTQATIPTFPSGPTYIGMLRPAPEPPAKVR